MDKKYPLFFIIHLRSGCMNRIFIPAVLLSITLILSLIYLINQGLDLAAIIFASGVLVVLMLASYVYQQIRLSVRECIKESTK